MLDTRDLGRFQQAFLAVVTGPPPADTGLRVHHDTWFFGLVDTLRNTFPAMNRVVGTESFNAVARDYIRRHPLKTPCLNTYGDAMAAWLHDRDPAWLSDLAAFEWATNIAHHAEDAVPCGFDDLLAPDGRCALHPSTQILWLEFDVMALQAGKTDAIPERRPQSILVGRTPDDSVIWLPLNIVEAEFIARIGLYGALFAVLEAMAPDEGEMTSLQILLARLVQAGLLISI